MSARVKANESRPVRAAKLAEKVILGFIAGAAAVVGMIEIVFLIRHIRNLQAADTWLLGVPLGEPISIGISSPAILNSTASAVDLTVIGLSDGAKTALAGAAVLASLVLLSTCAAVAWLCVRVLLGRPFVRSATWGIGIVAILLILAGCLTPVLTRIADVEASEAAGLGELPPLLFNFDLGPIAGGLALGVVAAAFAIGARIQRETEGLV